jgi:hypothetical protein
MHFVVIFGPPAVGKMTVGHELAKLTGFKLFHNHMTVEPVLDIFPFGSPPFGRLVDEFRRRVIEEACDAELPGLIFTFVWGLELDSDRAMVASYVDIVESRGGQVHFVELVADQAERLIRNTTEFRLEQKKSKRDVEFSRNNLLELDEKYVMNTGGVLSWYDVFGAVPCLRIDNTDSPAAGVATRILASLPLPS